MSNNVLKPNVGTMQTVKVGKKRGRTPFPVVLTPVGLWIKLCSN
jgi:hypothetical protein